MKHLLWVIGLAALIPAYMFFSKFNDSAPGQGRSNHPGQITHAVLEARPFSSRQWTRERLGDSPMTATEDAITRAYKEQERHRNRGIRNDCDREDQCGEGQTASGKSLAHARRAGTRPNPPVGRAAAEAGRNGDGQIGDCTEGRHRFHREVPLAHEVEREPREKEIPEIIGAE